VLLSDDRERVIGLREVEVSDEATDEAVEGLRREVGCWEEDEDSASSRWEGGGYEGGQLGLIGLG
jgi:hypothetical protein